MNPDFLIPFICLCVCLSWSICAKIQCDHNYDMVMFYESPLFLFIQVALAICIIIGVIIAWVNAGFLIALAYLGIAIGTIVLNMVTLAHLLISIFTYQGIGALLPLLGGVASAIWMFIQAGTFNNY